MTRADRSRSRDRTSARRAPVAESRASSGGAREVVADDDRSEQVARRAAERAANSFAPVPRGCLCCAAGMACSTHSARGAPAPVRPDGRPIAPEVRRQLEPALGVDLGGIHLDSSTRAADEARALGARAFTAGRDVAFAAGALAPETRAGRALLVHELIHATRDPDDGKLRRDADPARIGERVSTSSETGVSGPLAVNAHAWVQANAGRLVQELEPWLAQVRIDLPTPFIHWHATAAEFIHLLLEPLGRHPATVELMLETYLLPDRLIDAVNVGRDVAVMLFGPADWDAGVVAEVGRRLVVRIHESLFRVSDRVARMVARDWVPVMLPRVAPTARAPMPVSTMPDALWLPVTFDLSMMPAPVVAEAYTHPIDAHVASALRHSVDVDAFDYRRQHPEEFTPAAVAADQQPLRRVRLEFLAREGLSNWVRAVDPVDATPAEMGQELYGDPGMAYRLVAMAPLYALPAEDLPSTHEPIVIRMGPADLQLPEHLESRPVLRWEHLLALREAMSMAPSDRPFSSGIDPERELLESELADEAALHAAARIMPTAGANDELIRERMQVIASGLRQMEVPAAEMARPPGTARYALVYDVATRTTTEVPDDPLPVLEVRTKIRTARERVERRLDELDHRPGVGSIWDGQTAGQLEIVNTALNGVATAGFLARRYENWPNIFNIVRDVAMAYVDAAEISDLYEPARARLDAAERRSILFPATAMEVWLAALRASLDEARTTEITAVSLPNTADFRGVTEMDEMERDLRARLGRVRGLLLTDPDGAQTELQSILADISHLQTGVSIAMNFDTIDRVWQALYDNITFWGAVRSTWGGGNDIITARMQDALTLDTEWREILAVWRRGDRELARTQLEAKANGPWRTYVQSIADVIEDHQFWDAVSNFAAMVGIALLSGGIGAYVEAGVGAAWGVGAGASAWAEAGAIGVGVLTEATVFSTLTYPMQAGQPGSAGFGEYFLTNLAFTGGARALGRGFEAVFPAFARTGGGQFVNAAMQTTAMVGVNIAMANAQSQRDRGEGLDSHEIASIALENAEFVGATTLASLLLRTPLRNLRLRGHLDGLQFRHSRNLAALGRMMERLPPGRPPEALRRQLLDQVARSLETEQQLAAQMRSIVERTDRMEDPRARARELRRWGITDEAAAQFRSGEIPSDVLANLRMMQGVRVSRALEPVGNDFAIHPEMFDEAAAYFRSVPDTRVVSGDLATILDPTFQLTPTDTPGTFAVSAHGTFAVPIEHGARSFVVQSGHDAPFRVYERSRTASGELAPRVELARTPADVAAARGPSTTRGTGTGGRAHADPVRWGMPEPAIEALRQRVLAAGVGAIVDVARLAGIRTDRAALERVRRYLFDSQGIDFLPENYQWWQRLLNRQATVHDVAILVHELAENARLEQIQGETGFDYFGSQWEHLSDQQRREWSADFTRHYEDDAHVRALESEYDYLAQQVTAATNGRVRLGRNVVAAIDPVRAEGRDRMREGGYPLVDHIEFERWAARGDEVVEIGASAQERLRLPDRTPTLRELVEAVHRMAAAPELGPRGPGRPFEAPGVPMTVDSERRQGWRPGGRRGRGGAAWDPSAHPNPSVADILSVPFADGNNVGRELFWRGRDLLARARSLSPQEKADAFEQLAQRINQIDPSWMARRGPATNAVAMFSGDARPFGFAIDLEGGIWQIRDFTAGVTWGPGATVTLDYAQWQRVVP